MKLFNLVLVFFLLLAPNQPFQNCQPRGVKCDYVPSYDPRKRNENEIPTGCHGKSYKDFPEENSETLPARVHYEYTDVQRCLNGRKPQVEEFDINSRDKKFIKEAAVSCQAQKPKKQEQKTCKTSEKPTKPDCAKPDCAKHDCGKPETNCSAQQKKKSVFCADCEECEIQVKTSNDGVVLKCKNCREVPPEDIFFPSGNNRKIINLP